MSIFNQNLKSPIEVKVKWSRESSIPPLTLSISALMLNKENVINKIEDFVFYGTSNDGNAITLADKSVTCDALNFEKGFGTGGSYNMNLDLDKVCEDVDRINIVVSINTKGNDTQLPTFDSLIKAIFSIKDASGLTFTTDLNKTGETSCRCITVGLVRRYAQSWRFEEEMELKLGGLELVYNDYMSESILNNYPFSKIGDLSLIEKRYKESKNGTKNIIERTIEVISSEIGQLIGIKEQPKPWKGKTKRASIISDNVSPIGQKDKKQENTNKPSKPWKGKTKRISIISDNVSPIGQKDNKQENTNKPSKPWKGKTKRTRTISDSISQTVQNGIKQISTKENTWERIKEERKQDLENVEDSIIQTSSADVNSKRKFPKVKRPITETIQLELEQNKNGVVKTSAKKKKFPKVGKK